MRIAVGFVVLLLGVSPGAAAGQVSSDVAAGVGFGRVFWSPFFKWSPMIGGEYTVHVDDVNAFAFGAGHGRRTTHGVDRGGSRAWLSVFRAFGASGSYRVYVAPRRSAVRPYAEVGVGLGRQANVFLLSPANLVEGWVLAFAVGGMGGVELSGNGSPWFVRGAAGASRVIAFGGNLPLSQWLQGGADSLTGATVQVSVGFRFGARP